MESLAEEASPRRVRPGGEAWCDGREDMFASMNMLVVVPARNVILTCSNRILGGKTVRKHLLRTIFPEPHLDCGCGDCGCGEATLA